MGLIENLLFGLIGNHAINELEHRHERRIKERQQKRTDSLFWQDAARRKSNAFVDDGDDSLGLL